MRIFFVIILFFSLSLVNADDNQILLDEANKVYNEGSFEQAVELYEKVLENGFESAEVYYNLGNSFFKQNKIAAAILYYEKAKKLEPNDEDINFNLKIANNRIVDKIETVPELFYIQWWNTLIYALTVDQWGLLSAAFFALLLVMALIFFLSRVVWLKKVSFWFGVIFLISSLSTYALANQKFNSFKKDHEAIVFTPTVTVKSSPTESSIDLFVIHEGTKVELLDNVGEWHEISIANGSVGWIKVTDIRKI
jgi:tetratricopeptide (TPR) repeat protein